jgi:iron complex transport system ATP-binding protein
VGQALSLSCVSVRYESHRRAALENASLDVRPGEVTALLGSNGAGKSTLLRVAAGLVRPSSGRASLDGTDLAAWDRRALARHLALVTQGGPPAAGFRVRDVVAMGRAPHQGAWMKERPEDAAAVDDAIALCDLSTLADRPVEALSGGEQRRVAIARALAQKPRVLLLDEPAAFLDVRHRLMLHELLAQIAARDAIACVVATHDLDAAARFASAAVLMREGRVVAAGPPGEVMRPDRLAAVFDAEIAGGTHEPSGRPYFIPLQAQPPRS